jgi:hypothetical protein
MHLFLTILFICIAAVCKALADTLDQHFFNSIFRSKNRKYWDPNIMAKSAPQIFGYPLDVWHIANSIGIFCWCALPFVYQPCLPKWWMDYGAIGIIFIIVFNLFYNKVFR